MPIHLRHKAPTELQHPHELVLACPQFRSSVNLSRIVRLAGCAGIQNIVACGTTKIDPKIARNAVDWVDVQRKRTLVNWLEKARSQGFHIAALEQTDNSICLFDYQFRKKTVLVIGHERLGIKPEELAKVDDAIEIPVYGQPFSYNVVTATTMAVYEYCRQFGK